MSYEMTMQIPYPKDGVLWALPKYQVTVLVDTRHRIEFSITHVCSFSLSKFVYVYNFRIRGSVIDVAERNSPFVRAKFPQNTWTMPEIRCCLWCMSLYHPCTIHVSYLVCRFFSFDVNIAINLHVVIKCVPCDFVDKKSVLRQFLQNIIYREISCKYGVAVGKLWDRNHNMRQKWRIVWKLHFLWIFWP